MQLQRFQEVAQAPNFRRFGFFSQSLVAARPRWEVAGGVRRVCRAWNEIHFRPPVARACEVFWRARGVTGQFLQEGMILSQFER